ncbi:MAG: TetR family transcriptional regulator, partial [Myxococcales bacterium]|nr:TetR family transcriptional regulator [Myxococcales bacterium]
MGSRTRITDAALLGVAREVLLRDGITATTASVAAAAGVSEALLFKRFGTKDELFQRAMAVGRPAWVALLEDATVHPRDVLEQVALSMIASMREEMPLAMLSWSRNPSDHWGAYPGEPPPVTGMKILSGWFEAHIRAGHIRPVDP